MDNDFIVDLDGGMLNYSEMDSLIDSTNMDDPLSFPPLDDYLNDSSSSNSSSSSLKRKRKPVDPLKKKPRIDYKNPHHADRLLIAINTVISSLEGEPEAFHKNIMMIAKSHNIPYNTLRDNFLRARGIEPRAHRNSERKRQADALAAAAERGVVSVAKPSTLLVQTHPASVHVAGALLKDQLNDRNGSFIKVGPLPPRGLALAYAMSGPLGEAHAPPIGPRAVSYTASPPTLLLDNHVQSEDQHQAQTQLQTQTQTQTQTPKETDNDNQSFDQYNASLSINEDSDDSGDDEI